MAADEKKLAAIILAAGKGSRMNSGVPKVLTEVGGKPMIITVIDKLEDLDVDRIVVVLGHQAELVKPHLPEGVKATVQEELLGTAHAVNAARGAFEGFEGNVIVMYGDTPFIQKETLHSLLKIHNEKNAACTLLSRRIDDPSGYGRILRDEEDRIVRIIEDLDATKEQKGINEINVGLYCFRRFDLFEALLEVKPNPRKGEYYLTDVIEILWGKGLLVTGLVSENNLEAMGVNSIEDLEKAQTEMEKQDGGQ